jgi:hypothetical protein
MNTEIQSGEELIVGVYAFVIQREGTHQQVVQVNQHFKYQEHLPRHDSGTTPHPT